MYSTTKSVPGLKLCFQVMLAHLLLGSTVTFQMDCSSGAGRRVRRGVSGEDRGGIGDSERHIHIHAFSHSHPEYAGKGSSQERLCTGPNRATVLIARRRPASYPGLRRSSQRTCLHVKEIRKLSLTPHKIGTRVGFRSFHLVPFWNPCHRLKQCKERGKETGPVVRVQQTGRAGFSSPT